MYSYSDLLTFVEQEILDVKWETKHQTLYEPINYILQNGGKRVRPVLALMAIDMLGSYPKHFLQPVLGLEVFHNFTLLHDDLMDQSDTRRNNPTVHKKWNANTAILSGDAMLIAAYQLMAKCNEKELQSVMHIFSQTAMEVCEGQQLDMEFETQNKVSVDAYLEMIRLKTSVLLGASLKLGAILSKADERDSNFLYDFGINLGMAFQLKDDYLDVYGRQHTTGKPIGTDIVHNKKTYMFIRATERAVGVEHDELMQWINKKEFDPVQKIKAITAIYNALEVKEESNKLMNEYYKKAILCLKQVDVAEDRKKELYDFAERLVARES